MSEPESTDRLDLRAKEYARKVKRRRSEREIARHLRQAAAHIGAASTYLREFLESGGEDDGLTSDCIEDARRAVDEALGGVNEDSDTDSDNSDGGEK